MTKPPNIHRAAKFEGTFKDLVLSKDNPKGIFETMRETMVFLASLGYQAGRKMPLPPKEKKLALDGQPFQEADTIAFMLALAAVDQQDTSVLKQDGSILDPDVYTNFEAYINGGLHLVDEWYRESPHPDDPVAAALGLLESLGLVELLPSQGA